MNLDRILYDENGKPSHIYYDINIVNNDISGTLDAPPIQFSEVRNSPFLNNPGDFFLAVARFQLETPYLPLFMPFVQLGQSDVNLTIYSVSLSFTYLGTTYTQQAFVEYVQENNNVNTPVAPTTAQDFTTEYYWVQEYQRFVNMINDAYKTALNGLNTLVTGAGGVLPTANAPFFTFDNKGYLFTLNADVAGYDSALGAGNYISVFANAPLFTLFSAFDNVYNGSNNVAPNGTNYQYLIYQDHGMNQFTGTVAPYNYAMLQMTQSYSTTALWCPIKSIVFQSVSMPILPDLVGKPVVFTSNSGMTVGGNNANISLMLTDFVVGLDKGFEYKPNITYTPTVYRLIDMFGNQSLSSMDVSVMWTDMLGNSYRVKLLPQRSCQIKLMFRAKRYSV